MKSHMLSNVPGTRSGIISFVLSIVLVALGICVRAFSAGTASWFKEASIHSVFLFLVWACIIAVGVIAMVCVGICGTILGYRGLKAGSTSRVLGAIGLAINGTFLVVFALLMAR